MMEKNIDGAFNLQMKDEKGKELIELIKERMKK